MDYSICAYSLPHIMGYLKTKGGASCDKPLTPTELMDWAVSRSLKGIEIPLQSIVPTFDGAKVETGWKGDFRAETEQRNLRLIADYGAILDHNWEHLRDYITLAAANGVKIVRVILSHILCGDRREFLPQTFLEARKPHIERLKLALDHAASLGLCIAVENHQDVTCDELLMIWEQVGNHPAYGIIMDTGNPLAVGEDPVSFAQRAAHLIRHLHLKDYTIHFAPNGYRLVRCAAGDGCIDFPTILKIVAQNGHDIMPAIETAAQATRTIPILEETWWQTFDHAHANRLPVALQTLWRHGIAADVPYPSAWEREAETDEVCREEWDLVERSVTYFRNYDNALSPAPATV